jgi:uncharacterized protein Usg
MLDDNRATDAAERTAAQQPNGRTATTRSSQTMTRGTELQQQLLGYRLTTAEILYHLPDHPSVLQTYVWQELDIAPRFPVLRRFLDFWERRIEGRLHSVRVASAGIVSPAEWRHAAHMQHLH